MPNGRGPHRASRAHQHSGGRQHRIRLGRVPYGTYTNYHHLMHVTINVPWKHCSCFILEAPSTCLIATVGCVVECEELHRFRGFYFLVPIALCTLQSNPRLAIRMVDCHMPYATGSHVRPRPLLIHVNVWKRHSFW